MFSHTDVDSTPRSSAAVSLARQSLAVEIHEPPFRSQGSDLYDQKLIQSLPQTHLLISALVILEVPFDLLDYGL